MSTIQASEVSSAIQKSASSRRLLRPWIWITLAALLLLAATPFAIRGFYLTRVPYIDELSGISDYRTIDVTPEENAINLYAKAIAMYSVGRMTHEDWDEVYPVHGDPVTIPPRLKDYLEKNKTALDVWRQGTELPKFVEHQPGAVGLATEFPMIPALRDFVRLAELRFLECHSARDEDEAWLWLRAILKNGRQLEESGGVIQRFSGMASEDLAVQRLPHWTSSSTLTSRHLAKALDDVREIGPCPAKASLLLRYEYVYLQNLFARPDWSYFYEIPVFPQIDGLPRKFVLFVRGEPDYTQLVLRHSLQNMLTYCDRPRWKRPHRCGNYFSVEPQDANSLIPVATLEAARRHANTGFVEQITYLEIEPFDGAAADWTCLEIDLCAQLYYRNTGHFPESLNDLVPDYLATIPLDPMSPGPEPLPISYRRTETGAVVYSIGENGVDDGGNVPSADQTPSDRGWYLLAPDRPVAQ